LYEEIEKKTLSIGLQLEMLVIKNHKYSLSKKYLYYLIKINSILCSCLLSYSLQIKQSNKEPPNQTPTRFLLARKRYQAYKHLMRGRYLFLRL